MLNHSVIGKKKYFIKYIYMSLIKQTKLISLNSSDGIIQHNQSAGYLSDVIFNFKQLLGESKNIIYSAISVHSVDMTNSFYNVNELNNIINIKITIVSGGNETLHTLTIPVGNYSASTFVITFNALLLAGTGKAGVLAIDRNNGLYSLTPDANTYTITILPTSTAYKILGLTPNTTPVFTFSGNHLFNKGCNFLGITHLNIFSKALASDNIDSKSKSQNNLISVIPVIAPSYAIITYESRNEESFLKNKNIADIDILITDNDGSLVNFNFIEWNITFSIHTYRLIDVAKMVNEIEFKDLLNVKKDDKPKPKKKIAKPKPDKELDLLLS
tara:strand:- start:1718 stop:2701 length:984 start_codon:yes stop_codon:yes gene_type:complete